MAIKHNPLFARTGASLLDIVVAIVVALHHEGLALGPVVERADNASRELLTPIQYARSVSVCRPAGLLAFSA
eukprot:SAG11_NODE_495_length_8943_cov_274.008028_5_plen_72_part_00